MKQFYLFLIGTTLTLTASAQIEAPKGIQTNQQPLWGMTTKTATDSCGPYFNNYVGIGKTSNIRIESMRTGNAIENGQYNGRAQKFKAPQPIEISGIEFYAYIKDNPGVDSLMVITTLNDYDASQNTLGTELARDTVYVHHSAFNPQGTPLPNIAVQSYFENPVTVTSDYMIAMVTPTDDSLKIIANDPFSFDGNNEGMGYALYDNVNFPSFFGWYDMILDFTADYDFLLSPLIEFKLHDGFNVSDTLLCPGVDDHICLTYDQMPVYAEGQYNAMSNPALGYLGIDWGDSQSDANTDSVCHSYLQSQAYTITLTDTFFRWENNLPVCNIELTQPVTVQDSITIGFSSTQSGLDVSFTSAVTGADSVSWDFGDGSPATDDLNPVHTYQTPGQYSVWLHAYNDCMTSSFFQTIQVGPIGIDPAVSNHFSIYPNPAKSSVNLKQCPADAKVYIYNIMGEKVKFRTSGNNNSQIDISHLPNGTYFLKVISASGTHTKKLIVKH